MCVAYRLLLNIKSLSSKQRQHYKGKHHCKPMPLTQHCHRFEGEPADRPGTKTTAAYRSLTSRKMAGCGKIVSPSLIK